MTNFINRSRDRIYRAATVRERKIREATNGAGLVMFSQLFRFGLVGITAATIHFSVVVLLVQNHSFEPLAANIFAFLIAFHVSYFGHRHITFNGTTALHAVAFPKLFTLQIVNFIANESFFYFLLALHLPYQVALLVVLATLPLFTFIVSKWWVFKR